MPPLSQHRIDEGSTHRVPSLAIRHFGTEEEAAGRRRIAAGPLTAILQAGALRSISLAGREIIRGIAFVVRDENWGTCKPRVFDLHISEHRGEIHAAYSAECRNGDGRLRYSAAIVAQPDGLLEFSVEAMARSPFLTCRAGFVVLHPLEGVAGRPVAVRHTDGSMQRGSLPGRIQPSQPFLDIRSLSHRLSRSCTVTCTIEGDACEMEDQRNWSDASYKTYARPLSRPFPYMLEAGTPLTQRVVVRADGSIPKNVPGTRQDGDCVSIGASADGRFPELSLAIHPDHAEAAQRVTTLARQARIGRLVCTFDASSGHDAGTMAQFRRLGDATGASLVLEAVLPLRDAQGQFTDDEGVLDADLARLKCAADDAGAEFAVVTPSPACYLKSWQPDGQWPNAPPLATVYAAVRRAFPRARIAGGMHSYFTELNRCRPPVDAIDAVTHSTCPIVHAADDASVMESLEALPWIFESVRALFPGKPYWIGPTAIGMRFNPYGASTMSNPENVRKPMAVLDPRQRGLFNAAWSLGYIARAAAGRVDGLCLSSLAGPNGISWQPMKWRQPWFDDEASSGAVFPVYHVIAGLARHAGATLREVRVSAPSVLAAIALDLDGGLEVWLANLTPERRTVTLQGVDSTVRIERLDAQSFRNCCAGPDGMASTATIAASASVTVDSHAVLRISPA